MCGETLDFFSSRALSWRLKIWVSRGTVDPCTSTDFDFKQSGSLEVAGLGVIVGGGARRTMFGGVGL